MGISGGGENSLCRLSALVIGGWNLSGQKGLSAFIGVRGRGVTVTPASYPRASGVSLTIVLGQALNPPRHYVRPVHVHVMLGLKILHFVTLLTWSHVVLAAAPVCYGSVKSKLKHSERSMGHAHVMALKRRPELAQKPSAHWQQRAHFASSAAALRGEQLAQAVKVTT